MRSSLARLVVLFVLSIFFSSWGFLVHKTVHQLAVYELPKPLRGFYYMNMQYVVDSAPRPDIRRNADPLEAPRHFIDLEVYGDSAAWKMPMNWNDAERIYSKDTLLKYGFLPYHIISIKNKLVASFRARNKDSILFYSTDLAHYIGDANVPLHTSVNYDGQLTNQKGLHSLWESRVPELELDQYKLNSGHKARYLANPEEAIWNCIRRSYKLLPDVFAKELAASRQFTDSTKYVMQTRQSRQVRTYSPAFIKAYSLLLGNTVNEQLRNSSDLIADFWYTSWVDAGRPDLTTIQSFKKADCKNFKKERKFLRKGLLIEKGMLVARKQAGTD